MCHKVGASFTITTLPAVWWKEEHHILECDSNGIEFYFHLYHNLSKDHIT